MAYQHTPAHFENVPGTAAQWAAALVQDRTQESGRGETSATIKHGDSAKLGGYA
jgi:hypothetical protein